MPGGKWSGLSCKPGSLALTLFLESGPCQGSGARRAAAWARATQNKAAARRRRPCAGPLAGDRLLQGASGPGVLAPTGRFQGLALPVGSRGSLLCGRSPENPRTPGTGTEVVLIRAER